MCYRGEGPGGRRAREGWDPPGTAAQALTIAPSMAGGAVGHHRTKIVLPCPISVTDDARAEALEFSNEEIRRYSRHLMRPEVTLTKLDMHRLREKQETKTHFGPELDEDDCPDCPPQFDGKQLPPPYLPVDK